MKQLLLLFSLSLLSVDDDGELLLRVTIILYPSALSFILLLFHLILIDPLTVSITITAAATLIKLDSPWLWLVGGKMKCNPKKKRSESSSR